MITHILCEGNAILNAENAKVEMETLRVSRDYNELPFVRLKYAMEIIDTIIKCLSPEDRQQLEAYEQGESRIC